METCCEYTDSVMWVSTDERRMITRMMKQIAPPVKREMSEKQLAAAEKNLQKAQAQRRLSEKS